MEQKKATDELKEKYPESIFLRTLIKNDVHSRLTTFAKHYSNGMQKWDYGVAIEILLDFYDHSMKQSNINVVEAKIDYVAEQVNTMLKQTTKPKDENVPSIELLGGRKEEI
jgi:hypothetical protein